MLRMFIRTMADQAAAAPKQLPLTVFGLEGRYVTALYRAASQVNELEQVEKGLLDIQKVLTKPKIVDFVRTSLLSRAAKAKLVASISNDANMPKLVTNFLTLVAENGRLKMLGRMIKLFLAVMVAHRNEALCEVITADPLDDATRTKLIAILKRFVPEGKKIRLKEIVAADAIGGVVIGFEDKHIDMTIAARLTLYRRQIENVRYQ